MRLSLGSLPVGSHTADERLLDQLQELAEKLDAESESLLETIEASNDEEPDNKELEQKKEPFGVVYVKDLDGDKAVGYLKYVPMCEGRIWRISDLYVEKEYRRNCIGYILMKKFYDLFKKSGGTKINLGCIAANKEGIAFYENEGFRISDATYILSQINVKQKKVSLQMQERKFDAEVFNRIWNEMQSYLDKNVNLPEEAAMMRSWYMDNPSFKPFSICSFDGFKCAVFVHSRDSELYVPVFSIDPKNLDQKLLDEIAYALLKYARKNKISQVCIADIHLPSTLDQKSSLWKKVGCTFFKMISDLLPKKSKLRI